MLILSRKTGESLMIGNEIVVTVLDASQRQVRIGISAPKEIAVLREEIYLREIETSSPSKSDLQCSSTPRPGKLERAQ